MWHEEEFDNKWQRRPKPQFFGQRGHFGCKLVKEIFNSEGASTQRAFDKNSKGTWLRHTRRPTVPSKTFSIGLLHWARSGPPAELGPIPAQKKEKHNEISFNAFSFHGKTVNEKKDRGNSVKKSLKWKESTWENVVRSMWRQQRAQTGETASEESNGDSSHALNLLPIRTPLGPTTPLPVYRFPLSTLKHNRYLFFLTTRHQQFAGANYPIFHAFSKRCRFVPSFHYLLLCFFLLLSCDIILFLSLRGSLLSQLQGCLGGLIWEASQREKASVFTGGEEEEEEKNGGFKGSFDGTGRSRFCCCFACRSGSVYSSSSCPHQRRSVLSLVLALLFSFFCLISFCSELYISDLRSVSEKVWSLAVNV